MCWGTCNCQIIRRKYDSVPSVPKQVKRDHNASCSPSSGYSLPPLPNHPSTMDIEIDDFDQAAYGGTGSIPKSAEKRPAIMPVDDAHPFDLDAYISGYSGPCHTCVGVGLPLTFAIQEEPPWTV